MSKLTPPVNKNDHTQGPASAPLTLVEYGDYQCPHCGAAYPILKRIEHEYAGRLRFVFRNFPLSNVHEFALPAALAAEAAGKQQRFWEMHDLLFQHQDELSRMAIQEFAMVLRLNIPVFKMDLQDKALEEKIESDFESGVRSGVNGTPSFFINGTKYNGAYDQRSLSKAIAEHLQPA
ncbi:MAG TPA: thioredoxin domain-containing protein [Puia sp.]|nr:thioredoxin domain-containing protein [Puia sp.]